ncbi:MAG: hypothetical protein QOJ81_55 [Chloroflexota bacterium]|jgi:hypothetical protein|nr:hypothetical protein [Chloroflexota bacterium]
MPGAAGPDTMPWSIVLAAAGAAALVVALLLLRSLGTRFRIGRLLSAAREVTLEECRELAAGAAVYVRVSGRISSTEEFPDDNDRPLVFRRTRLEVQVAPDRWRTVRDEREAVPFGVESRSEFVAIDQDALRDGLVAIPRIATGRVAELQADMAAAASGADPDSPVRLTIEQLSAVEQVSVCGKPEMRDGQPTLTAGLGRPLIVTALDRPAAMRLLASGARRRVAAAALLIAGGLALVALAVGVAVLATALAAPVLAASPTALPTPEPSTVIGVPTDPRAGGGAPLVGAPGLALLAVAGAGLGAALATLAYVRLTARPTSRPASRPIGRSSPRR